MQLVWHKLEEYISREIEPSTLLSSSTIKKIDVKQLRSTDNFADLFTKVLPTLTFEKLV